VLHKSLRPARAFEHRPVVLAGCALGAAIAALVLLAAAPALAGTAGGTSTDDQTSQTTPEPQQPEQNGSIRPATPPPAPSGFGRRLLRRGARGADVRFLQSLLSRLGFRTSADGIFGRGTERQVKAWERSVRGKVDGRVPPGQAKEMLRRSARPTTNTQPTTPAASGPYVFPVRGSHSFGTAVNRFGAPRSGHTHQGHDILADSGTPVAAARGGKVSTVGSGSGAGNYVVIQADDNTDMAYMHLLSRASVSEGQTVSTGQIIGRVGCTGSCTAPHLHFELWTPHWWDGGEAFDPLPRLREWDGIS
jgi:murein DD-endopeptidase MepM/ murein hydrolase activator NlpD